MRKRRLESIKIKKLDHECWSLDRAFVKWLKPHLVQYLRRGGKIVDLTYHKFTVRGVEKNQLEWINEMMYLCDHLLTTYAEFWEDPDEFLDKQRYLCEIWAEVMPAMWW